MTFFTRIMVKKWEWIYSVLTVQMCFWWKPNVGSILGVVQYVAKLQSIFCHWINQKYGMSILSIHFLIEIKFGGALIAGKQSIFNYDAAGQLVRTLESTLL